MRCDDWWREGRVRSLAVPGWFGGVESLSWAGPAGWLREGGSRLPHSKAFDGLVRSGAAVGLWGEGRAGDRRAGWRGLVRMRDDGAEMANGAEESGCAGGARMERTRRTRRALGRRPLSASAPTVANGRPIQTPIGRTSARSGSVQQQCIRSEGGSRANLKQVLPPPPDRIHVIHVRLISERHE